MVKTPYWFRGENDKRRTRSSLRSRNPMWQFSISYFAILNLFDFEKISKAQMELLTAITCMATKSQPETESRLETSSHGVFYGHQKSTWDKIEIGNWQLRPPISEIGGLNFVFCFRFSVLGKKNWIQLWIESQIRNLQFRLSLLEFNWKSKLQIGGTSREELVFAAAYGHYIIR